MSTHVPFKPLYKLCINNLIELNNCDSCLSHCNQITKISTINFMKVKAMVKSITWLWMPCYEQLIVGIVELLHSLAICAGVLHCIPLVWDVIYVQPKWGALHTKNSECQGCTISKPYFTHRKCWHHGRKFWVKIMWPIYFNFICQVHHRQPALRLRHILCLLFQPNEKTTQMGTSIGNGLDHPSMLLVLNAPKDAPWNSKSQVEILSPNCTNYYNITVHFHKKVLMKYIYA